MDTFTQQVNAIAQEQGWSDETIGALALEFLGQTGEPGTQRFIEFLRETQSVENEQ